MTALIQSTPLKRVFKLGSLEVDCECPNATFEESIKAIRKNYSFFRFGKIYEDDGIVEDDRIVYNLPKLPPNSNG